MKFIWSAILFVVLSGRSKDNSRSPLMSQLGELHVKAGFVLTLLRLAGTPSLHVNRPLKNQNASKALFTYVGHNIDKEQIPT